MPLRTRLPWLALALTAAAVVLPPQAAGCAGKTACIKARNGTCPSAAEATNFFGNGCDFGSVQSADGEATFDGEFCCYPVTESSGNGDFPASCGAGGAVVGGVGGGAVGGSGGGGGASPPTLSCAMCACDLLISEGGCKDLCDMNFAGTTNPNFCNGANALSQCTACIETTCGEDPSSCE